MTKWYKGCNCVECSQIREDISSYGPELSGCGCNDESNKHCNNRKAESECCQDEVEEKTSCCQDLQGDDDVFAVDTPRGFELRESSKGAPPDKVIFLNYLELIARHMEDQNAILNKIRIELKSLKRIGGI